MLLEEALGRCLELCSLNPWAGQLVSLPQGFENGSVSSLQSLRRISHTECASTVGKKPQSRIKIDDEGLPPSQQPFSTTRVVRDGSFLRRSDDVAIRLLETMAGQHDGDLSP